MINHFATRDLALAHLKSKEFRPVTGRPEGHSWIKFEDGVRLIATIHPIPGSECVQLAIYVK